MIELNIPGCGILQLQHLVFDVEGTLTLDGRLPVELVRPLTALRDRLDLHLLATDTYREQAHLEHRLSLKAVVAAEAAQKTRYVQDLGADRVAAVGQGADDTAMLKAAALGICVLSPEGVAPETMLAADLVVPNITSAIELLTNPLRIVNSLRK